MLEAGMERGRLVFLIQVVLSGAAVDVELTGSLDRMSPWQRFLLLTWIQPRQTVTFSVAHHSFRSAA